MWSEQHAADMFAFEMILYREMEQDAMTWQTPALAMTAQSFLLTIALDPARDAWARALTAGLGLLIALLAWQLLAKHIFLNATDRAQLRVLERRMGLPRLSERKWAPHDDLVLPRRGFLERQSSGRLWRRGMAIMALSNTAIAVVVLWSPARTLAHWVF